MTSSTKQAEVVEQALAEGLLDLREAPFDAEATWADICRVHDPAYVQAVRTGKPRELAESQWFTWSPAFADSVARIWSGHLAASRLALTEGMVLHPVSGSHHAKRDHGAAFCTFAYVVGASKSLLDGGLVARVLLLDLDAHEGDGHHLLTKDDPRIYHFDISANGRRRIRREGRGIWIESPGAAHYLDTLFDELPPLLDRTQPNLVQVLLGVDAHEDDDLGGLGGMRAGRLAARDRFVLRELAARRVPVVISLAGGYSPRCVELHLQTLGEAVAALSSSRAC